MPKPTILIIAGGKNSRFFPLNNSTHKAFSPIAGKPLLVRVLESLQDHGFERVVLVVSAKDFGADGIEAELRQYNLRLTVVVLLQESPKGQGDAILTARKELGDQFILAAPYYTNLGEQAQTLWEHQQKTESNCVLMATETDTPSLYGILKVDGDQVSGVIEKPKPGSEPSNLRVNSVYLLDQGFIDALANTPDQEYSLEAALSSYATTASITWIKNTQTLPSLKFPWHLFVFMQQLLAQQTSHKNPGAEISNTAVIDESHGPVVIEAGAKIGHAVKIVGPAYIGKNVLVGDFSFIRESSLEENVTVGAYTEVVRSLFLPNSSIHQSYLADSIVGANAKIGAGLITANKRLDRATIRTKVKGAKIDTHLHRFGIVVGERASLGIRVSTMPGILIGSEAIIHPGLTVFTNIAHQETLTRA